MNAIKDTEKLEDSCAFQKLVNKLFEIDATMLPIIERKFRKLSLQYHPDKHGNQELFQVLGLMREIAKDKVSGCKRKRDDERHGSYPQSGSQDYEEIMELIAQLKAQTEKNKISSQKDREMKEYYDAEMQKLDAASKEREEQDRIAYMQRNKEYKGKWKAEQARLRSKKQKHDRYQEMENVRRNDNNNNNNSDASSWYSGIMGIDQLMGFFVGNESESEKIKDYLRRALSDRNVFGSYNYHAGFSKGFMEFDTWVRANGKNLSTLDNAKDAMEAYKIYYNHFDREDQSSPPPYQQRNYYEQLAIDAEADIIDDDDEDNYFINHLSAIENRLEQQPDYKLLKKNHQNLKPFVKWATEKFGYSINLFDAKHLIEMYLDHFKHKTVGGSKWTRNRNHRRQKNAVSRSKEKNLFLGRPRRRHRIMTRRTDEKQLFGGRGARKTRCV